MSVPYVVYIKACIHTFQMCTPYTRAVNKSMYTLVHLFAPTFSNVDSCTIEWKTLVVEKLW